MYILRKMYRPLIQSFAAKQLSTALRPGAVRTFASAHATPQPFNWEDPLGSQSLLTDEELAIAETAESYCQERMLPRVLGMRAFRIIPSKSANSAFVP
jgi:glutaryl-CoA dehydrogenase